MDIELSIVIPVFNEAENLKVLFERLFSVLLKLDIYYEVIVVNDGSRDQTLAISIAHQKKYPEIIVVDLSRNFGKDIALSAGLDQAKGRAVIPIDADLQDPPELITELLKKWREGYEIVYATRQNRLGESWIKRLTAAGFYKIIRSISSVPIPANTGDFRLLDRQVIDALKKFPERTRFMKGLFVWVGYKPEVLNVKK